MGSRIDNTIVVIPSYNEARTIGSVVDDIVSMGLTVLVVDDGSTDDTEKTALDGGAMVIRNKKNMGKGNSIRYAIKYVTEKTNFEWIAMMDGDAQHHPEDLPILMNAAKDAEADLVTGNRMGRTDNMPAMRYWTNRFMSFVISSICRQKIPDTQCGYRLVKVSAIKKITLESGRYDIESEMLIQAAHEGLKIVSVPVQTIYGDEMSAIRPFRDTLRFFALLVKYYLRPFLKRFGHVSDRS